MKKALLKTQSKPNNAFRKFKMEEIIKKSQEKIDLIEHDIFLLKLQLDKTIEQKTELILGEAQKIDLVLRKSKYNW